MANKIIVPIAELTETISDGAKLAVPKDGCTLLGNW